MAFRVYPAWLFVRGIAFTLVPKPRESSVCCPVFGDRPPFGLPIAEPAHHRLEQLHLGWSLSAMAAGSGRQLAGSVSSMKL
jgi:hypothetical protein